MAFIQSGRNRDCDHAFLPHPFENGRIHFLSDALFPRIGIGGIVGQETGFRFAVQSESDESDDFPIALADITLPGKFRREFRQLIPFVQKAVFIENGIKFISELFLETGKNIFPCPVSDLNDRFQIVRLK